MVLRLNDNDAQGRLKHSCCISFIQKLFTVLVMAFTDRRRWSMLMLISFSKFRLRGKQSVLSTFVGWKCFRSEVKPSCGGSQ
jgi:hypothetical protein